MERLTKRYEDIGCIPERFEKIDKCYADMCRKSEEYNRLKEAKQALKLTQMGVRG